MMAMQMKIIVNRTSMNDDHGIFFVTYEFVNLALSCRADAARFGIETS